MSRSGESKVVLTGLMGTKSTVAKERSSVEAREEYDRRISEL